MPIPRRSLGLLTAALAALAQLERTAERTDLDPLDCVLPMTLADAAVVLQAEGEDLDALRRRMVRLGMKTRG